MEPKLNGYQGILREIEAGEASSLRISLEEYWRRKRAFLGPWSSGTYSTGRAEVEALSKLPVVATPRGSARGIKKEGDIPRAKDGRWRRKMERINLRRARAIKALMREKKGRDHEA